MTCPHCDSQIPDISVFCPTCGRSVNLAHEPLKAAGRRDALLGAVAYLAVIPAIVLLVMPSLKANRFVRFHSWQSLFLTIAAAIFGVALKLLFMMASVLSVVGLVAWLSLGVGLLALVFLWIVLVTKALQGKVFESPVFGPLASRLAGREHLY